MPEKGCMSSGRYPSYGICFLRLFFAASVRKKKSNNEQLKKKSDSEFRIYSALIVMALISSIVSIEHFFPLFLSSISHHLHVIPLFHRFLSLDQNLLEEEVLTAPC